MKMTNFAIISFKLLAMIIITVALGVLSFVLLPQKSTEELLLMQGVPSMYESLIYSLTIFTFGFVIWYIFEKKQGAKNSV